MIVMVKYADMTPEQKTAEVARVKAWNKAHSEQHHKWDRDHSEYYKTYRKEHPDKFAAASNRWRERKSEYCADVSAAKFEVRRLVGETVSEILRLFSKQHKYQLSGEIEYDPTEGWGIAINGITEILYPRKSRRERITRDL